MTAHLPIYDPFGQASRHTRYTVIITLRESIIIYIVFSNNVSYNRKVYYSTWTVFHTPNLWCFLARFSSTFFSHPYSRDSQTPIKKLLYKYSFFVICKFVFFIFFIIIICFANRFVFNNDYIYTYIYYCRINLLFYDILNTSLLYE